MVEIPAIGLAISVVGWLAAPCINRLLDRAYAYIKPGKAREDIRSLVSHIIPNLILIVEAAEHHGLDHHFEKLLADLKSAFYASEDILDELEYIHRHHQHQRPRFYTARLLLSNLGCTPHMPCGELDSSVQYGSSNQACASSSNLTIPRQLSDLLKKNVNEIETLIEEANKTMNLANLRRNRESDNDIPNVTADNRKMSSISDIVTEVTGRVEELQEIAKMLRQIEDNAMPSSSDSTRLSVIGIIGIPGSGKTTLAQCVRKSERDDDYFDLVMWIHVTKHFIVKDIYTEMLEQASPNEKRPESKSLDMLKKELENVLKGKRILLVLDDIWFSKVSTVEGDIENKLQMLFSPLKVGKGGSKILVTSRQDSLSCLGPNVSSKTYQIPDLDDKDFLKLFMHYALNYNNIKMEQEGQLRQIGAQIAKKLKKSPLLAIAVGRTLFRKPRVDVSDWICVRDQNLLNDHIGALWWCYQHLGEQARRCFAYCSIFPRRYLLRRDELVNLWVAEGFINITSREQDMEYVGRGYFDELLSTSFLLPRGNDKHGEYFVIHDLLHDLAVKVAGSDCFKIENGPTDTVPPDVRHLLITGCTASMLTGHIVKLKQLRTLIIYDAENGITGEVFHKMFRELSKLRVLIFRTKGLHQIRPSMPGSIGCLKHLRYLSFVTAGINNITLPHTLQKLYLLQVLQFSPPGLYDLPYKKEMAKLVDLRHIIYATVAFPNIGKLTSIRTMPTVYLWKSKGYELHQLKHLNKIQGKLEICFLENVKSKREALEAKICDKEQLTEMILSWKEPESVTPDIQADVLEGLQPPEYLNELTISRYKGSRCPSWMVGTKRSTIKMNELELYSCSQPVSGPELFFINVSVLVLHRCNWDTLPYNMEHLRCLKLEDCDTLPSNMAYVTSLTRLIIIFSNEMDNITLPTLPKSLNRIVIAGWASKIREYQNWEKIKDIAEIFIDRVKFEGPRGDANPSGHGSEAT